MLGSYICYTLEGTFGYLLPAYQTYKSIEFGTGDDDSLKNWCIYWGIIGAWTVCEKFLDKIFFWVPLYDEFKVVFVVWLWYERCSGAKYLYHTWLLPWLNKHQLMIDQQLEDIRNKLLTLLTKQSTQFVSYLKTVFFRVLYLINQIHHEITQEQLQANIDQQNGQEEVVGENWTQQGMMPLTPSAQDQREGPSQNNYIYDKHKKINLRERTKYQAVK
eukprot:TRINITY_DN618_c0_g2_i8.p2 TRINITY_DN618_c0_g2~~TRINITY_DN618_c0_g2_i8.p2  ORF type:complete len:226 (+),score=11.81 TRINITY_DN618_c0_g2_i8:28-678(+)